MKEKNKIILLVSTVPVLQLWYLFYEKNLRILSLWRQIGVDINKEYDLFLFSENEQLLRWYVHYTAYYYTLIIMSFVLWKTAGSVIWKNFMMVLLWFSIFRLTEYWMFRFSIGFTVISTAIVIFTLLIIQGYGKYGRV